MEDGQDWQKSWRYVYEDPEPFEVPAMLWWL